MNTKNYCIILAGGKGKRLWPSSRDNKPKQFIDFFGVGRTQLQATYDRFVKIMPKDNILITTNQEYAAMVKEQLPDLPDDNIVIEQVNRNTAPSVAWGMLKIANRDIDARVIVSPSDLFVLNEQAFDDNVNTALDLVGEHNVVITMGVKPTRPEPGYGYIQLGEPTPKKTYITSARLPRSLSASLHRCLWIAASSTGTPACFSQTSPPSLRLARNCLSN